MTHKRKRERPFQDEAEFMPLSKRINNLHINNGMAMDVSPLTPIEWGPGPPHQLPESPPNSEPGVDWTHSTQYSPDLDENQNPHYFNINKLLFEMYIERLQRGCHQV
ncbi:uncharacterized protein LOC132699794 [Cylas formicarius]|uniref:uncharacterized protein LOC132699794 n=1 Tax=Cylas formicarius TaxID=197179 RepID=UPI002958AF1E|nr:uncharacterized protein LOC132699794 [Cylas formicarius]